MRGWWAAIALASTSVTSMAADAPTRPAARPGDLTLARVFGNPDLSGQTPRALKLSPDGAFITVLKSRPDEKERSDLWAIDTRTGAERMLVDSRKVGSGAELSEAEKMQRERARIGGQRGVVGYDWAPDGRSILVPLDGQLYLAGLDGKVRAVAGTQGVLNPAVSPRGGFVSFVRDQNLWVQPLGGDRAHPVTQGGAGTVHWGEAEFVAQEEMDRRTGYWWSPDDRRIAVERFDEAPVHTAVRASIGAAGTKTFEQRYPAAGTPNVLAELYVVNADGTGQVKVDLGPDRDIYLARVDWTPDGQTLLVQRESRDQRTLDMLRVDPATGRSAVLFSERAGAKSWINLSDAYHLMPDGSLLWSSERDGYRHLYRFAKGRWTQLTHGAWVVTGLVGVDEKKGVAWFTGTKDDVLEQHIYRLDLNRPGEPVRVTERGFTTQAGVMDSAATRLMVVRSGPAQPPQVYLADTEGKRLRWLAENAVAPGHPYYPYLASHRPTQFGTLKAADGSTLYWQMITPPLEPGKRYPVFFQHYGGPGTGQQVTRGWGGALPQFLVDRGWIFFQIDNRGSYNRGKAFEDQIWHAMGTVEVADQLAGANYLKTLPFVDGAKIATYGWSYGGYMSLKMLEKTPGVYAAAVSGAPVTDWRLYDTHYTERYLGDPAKDAKSYGGAAAVEDASKIRDPLLLIHGMADDNVFLTNSTMVVAEMQKTETPFEMMFYPGYTHRVGGPGISEHLWGTILDFLDRNVKNKPAQ